MTGTTGSVWSLYPGSADIFIFFSKAMFSFQKILFSGTVAFIFIWQILFNHELTKLKRFISQFIGKLCN